MHTAPMLNRLIPVVIALSLLSGCAAFQEPVYVPYRANGENFVLLKDSSRIPIDNGVTEMTVKGPSMVFGNQSVPFNSVARYQLNGEVWKHQNNEMIQKITDAPISLWQGQIYTIVTYGKFGPREHNIQHSFIQKGSGSIVKLNYPNLRQMIPDNGAGHQEMVSLGWSRRGAVFMMVGGAAAMIGGFLTFVDGSISENQTKKNIGYGLMGAGLISVPIGYYADKSNRRRIFKAMDAYNEGHGGANGDAKRKANRAKAAAAQKDGTEKPSHREERHKPGSKKK